MSKLQDAIDEVKRASVQHERDADWYNATARARRFAGTMSIENGWELAHLLKMEYGVEALIAVLPKPLNRQED